MIKKLITLIIMAIVTVACCSMLIDILVSRLPNINDINSIVVTNFQKQGRQIAVVKTRCNELHVHNLKLADSILIQKSTIDKLNERISLKNEQLFYMSMELAQLKYKVATQEKKIKEQEKKIKELTEI